MRFTFLMIALLLFAPVIAGCEGEKKKDPATESKADQDKKKPVTGMYGGGGGTAGGSGMTGGTVHN